MSVDKSRRPAGAEPDEDSALVAESIGQPSEASGIHIAIGPPGSPTSVVGIEYPMRMVDQQMIVLRERAIQAYEERRR
jgi:hypothetical protein